MRAVNIFVELMMTQCEFAYVTVMDVDSGNTVVEGLANSVRREFDYFTWPIKSFKVFEVEDGSILVDIYI